MQSVTATAGNPQESHEPLPELAKAAREVTLNPLSAKVTLERLASVDEDDNSNENGDGKCGKRSPTRTNSLSIISFNAV